MREKKGEEGMEDRIYTQITEREVKKHARPLRVRMIWARSENENENETET